jgi:coenzyme F420-dependent glucose-6-phosphate dehydrogenase
MARYFYNCAHEQFPPDDLLKQAVSAAAAGFDGISCSDHFQPWWEPGHSAMAWIWLGALGQATSGIPLGTAVTPAGARYHPALIAQGWATLEWMNPGRVFLGFGSGESLNESPVGDDWPSVGDQVARMDEALGLIRRLWDGERVTHEGRFWTTKEAFIHTLPARKPPIYVSAFGPKAAAVAARHGDGLWTLADPERAPKVIQAYEAACDAQGKEPGEIMLHVGFSWAPNDDAALEGARVLKATMPDEYYTDDWHDPKAMYRHAEETISDDEFKQSMIISSDPDVHVERIREIQKLGATTVVCMNISGADPHAAIDTWRESVLPKLSA